MYFTMSIDEYLIQETEELFDLKRVRTLSFYLDTSVPDALFLPPDHLMIVYNRVRQQATEEFWSKLRCELYTACISELYFREVETAPVEKRNRLLEIVSDLPIIKVDDKIEEVAETYIRNGLFPKIKRGDAIHLAAASSARTDALITWNFEDLLKCKTVDEVRKINKVLGLSYPLLITPLEVIRVYQNE